MQLTARDAEAGDHRVEAVLEVLAGDRVALVAARRGLDTALLGRWARAFVDAGTARVTNVPDEDAARSRDRFVAAVAHELRTPLTVAQGWSDMLEDPEAEPEDVELAAPRLGAALRRLHERVLDLELLAASSLGRLRLEHQDLVAADLVAGTDAAIAGTGGDVALRGDLDMLRRVVRDLWEAADLEPRPRARVVVVEGSTDWIDLRVVRHGDPMSTVQLQALFEPFDVNDDDTGITIGLYLARALVVAHRGMLGVEQDDQHAVFWVRIPAPSPVEQSAAHLAGGDLPPVRTHERHT